MNLKKISKEEKMQLSGGIIGVASLTPIIGGAASVITGIGSLFWFSKEIYDFYKGENFLPEIKEKSKNAFLYYKTTENKNITNILS